ncbi:MAG: hypothetical protein V4511_09225 [Bacteroidota bacterium]
MLAVIIRKKMRTILTILGLLTIIFYGCGDKGINDLSRRNENWVWFVDKKSGQGIWVPLGKNTTLENGNYTAFYFNGKIREKGKLVETKHADTTYYYDLNEKLIKYIVLIPDSSNQYYVNEGIYKAYSPKGEISVEGIVKGHKLTEINWHGAVDHFIQVFDAISPALIEFHKFAKELKTELNSYQGKDIILPTNQLKITDSLFLLSKATTLKSLEKLKTIKTFDTMPELKEAAINSMVTHKNYLDNQYSEIISFTKQGLKENNIDKTYSIFENILATDKTESVFSKAQNDFQLKFEFDEEQGRFLADRYKNLTY